MRDVLTSIADFLALILVSAGVSGGCWAWFGWWSLALGAVPLVLGSQLAAWQSRPASQPANPEQISA